MEYMQYDSKTSKVYWEMVGLFKDIFVKFYYSSFWDEIYQICVDGENYCLDSSAPKWNELTYGLPDDVVEIDRRKAEWIEDRRKGFIIKSQMIYRTVNMNCILLLTGN